MFIGTWTKRALTIATFSFSTICLTSAAQAADFTAPADAQMGDGLRHYEPAAAALAGEVGPKAGVCATGSTLQGVDISKWQGTVNWNSIAGDGATFAFVRVSDGLNTFDQKFDQNWANARAAGLKVGVYQFFRPAQDPIAQANLLLDHMGELQPGDLPPVIDVEDHGGLSATTVANKVTQWVQHVEAATGVKPIIYTGRFFWQDYVKTSAFSSYPLWIAHYTTGCPNLPSQWSNWTFHQYTDSGSWAGVSGNTDTNRFNGDMSKLLELTIGGSDPVCGDGVCGNTEDDSSCAADCAEPPSGCDAITSEGTIIDDGDPCYIFNGPAQWWRNVSGNDGDAKWTGTVKTSTTNSANVAFDFAEAGRYRIEAYVAGPNATSKQAKYKIQHADGQAQVVMNQSTKNGWVSLGDFNFDAGTGQGLSLADATGESNSLGRRVYFDSIKVTNLGPQQAHGPEEDEDDGGAWPTDLERGTDEQSCAVSPGARGSAWWSVLLLAGLARRRRRA
ncbi:MAG TPA: GH25 family lysozyme [Nannocystaceae bacterium]|nr:GH25 family lysozyme [Nannocystaceae bacterium]